MQGGARAYLALIFFYGGAFQDAERLAREAVVGLEDVPALRLHALAVLARVLLARGRVGEAMEAAAPAHEKLEGGFIVEEGEELVRLAYAEALHAAGEPDRAALALGRALDRLRTRSASISNPTWRGSFVAGNPEHSATVHLGLAWGLLAEDDPLAAAVSRVEPSRT
jgi:tetratricopeptide (TPR) repeat protein